MTPLISGRGVGRFVAILFVLTLMGYSTMAQAASHSSLPGGRPEMQTSAPTGVVVIKMAAGPVAHKSAAPAHLALTLAKVQPDADIIPRFQGLSKGLDQSVLSRYFQFETRNESRHSLLKIVATLNADPAVEVAFLEPVAVPAALGFDAFTGAVPSNDKSAGGGNEPQPGLDTPDFESQQEYLDSAPLGVGAWQMRDQAGALAAGITVIDVEGGWLWSHEDLPDPVVELGEQVDDIGWRNHGTAVIGEIRGQDNGIGVSGIAPQCSVGNSSIGETSTAGALAAAVDNLQAGDLILIELHAPGPNANGNGQFGYVPMEYWQDNFDVIRLATAKGILVCEAAGNGYQNLDGPEYMGLFDRSLRDSGAIMCGATAGGELFNADFSNNGDRVDLNGWGWYVTTCGYGDLQGGDETEWYTGQFSGTSSASPIVTGAVASLQGMVRQSLGFDLDARLARDLMRETGTPMNSGTLIGTRPNLVAAFAHADTIIGQIVGTVISQDTGLPVDGALIQVGGHGSFTMTDQNGQWRLPLIEGSHELTFSSYYHHSLSTSPPIIAGTTVTLDVTLVPLDLIDISGQVTGPGGPLAAVVVTPMDQPISGGTTDANGLFNLSGVPALYDYTLLFDGASGYGAWVEMVSTEGATGPVSVSVELPTVSEDFGFGGGGFVDEAGYWSHGMPPQEVTGGAFDSPFCWGIGMDGDYGDDQADVLLSPTYNLSGVAGEDYFLSFHYFGATEPGFDGVNLEVQTDGGFGLLEPLTGYTDLSLDALDSQPGWTGYTERWQGTVFDISDHTGGAFRFRLNFASDGGVTGPGFFIDAIAFGQGQNLSAVPGESTPAPMAAALQAWPNPFNPQVNLEYAVTRPGPLTVEVYDLRGNRVRTLLRAPVQQLRGTLNWDGRSDDGRLVSSGVYLVRLAGPDNQIVSQRVVLAK